MKQYAVLFYLLFPVLAGAQKPLVPGKKAVQQKWILNESAEMGWYTGSDTALTEVGRVKTIVNPGQALITVTTIVKLKQSKLPWTDSTIARQQTLAPVYHSSYNGQRDMQLHFGNRITGYYSDKIKNKITEIADSISTGYFDSNLYPLLIRWLPLHEGYQQEIAIYDYNPAGKPGLLKARITLVEKGIYKSPVSGNHAVWKVTVTDNIGSGNSSSIYSIDRKNRQLWQQEINTGNRKMWMKRIEK